MEKYQRLKDSIVKENKNNEEIEAMERRRQAENIRLNAEIKEISERGSKLQ